MDNRVNIIRILAERDIPKTIIYKYITCNIKIKKLICL